MREALELWASHVRQIIMPPAENVIALRPAGSA
jgi:hypothetical protein